MNSIANAAKKSKACASNAPRQDFSRANGCDTFFLASIRTQIISPTEKQVGAYQIDQLKDFYKKAYTPSNALLLVVGDFAGDEMMALVEKHFGSWTAPAPAPLKGDAPPQYVGRHVHLVHLPGAVQTQIVLGNMAITRRDPDWFACCWPTRCTAGRSIRGW